MKEEKTSQLLKYIFDRQTYADVYTLEYVLKQPDYMLYIPKWLYNICVYILGAYGLNLKGTQLSSYWFLKLLKVNRWYFSVGSLRFVRLSQFDNK